MKFIYAFCLCSLTGNLYAQTISGFLRDNKNTPVEFGSVNILLAEDSSFVSGSLTDSSGYYKSEKLKPGKYIVAGSQVGYTKTFGSVTVSDNKEYNLNLELKEENIQLGEVVVQAQKAVVVQEPGKIIFNVENTVSSAGLMAIDLLKRMPGVQVDNNGNITIKGKSEVQFMIDGKPSYLSAKQIAVILRSLPSNQISNIEVITSPSAKYDARGNAGIININLKKSLKKGVSGTLQATVGHGFFYKSNLGGSLSLGIKKWQMNVLYDLTNNINYENFTQSRNFGGAGATLRYNQNQQYEVPVENHNYRVTADYKPSDRLALGFVHRGMYVKERWTSTNKGLVTNQSGEVVQRIESHDFNPNYNSDLALGGNLKYKLDSAGHEFAADFEISNYKQRSIQNIFTTTYNHDTISTLDFFARQPLDNLIAFGKVDYNRSLLKQLKLETGYKISSIEILNTVDYNFKQTGTFLPKIPSNNRFFYSEQINAVYTSLKWDSTNWSVQLGIRAEHWHASGMLLNAAFKRDSLQFFPNVQAKYKVHKNHELTLAGSRRVDRPNYLMLNPIAYYSDPYTYYVGNPRILPQSTYQAELSHNYLGGALVTTINYSLTSNALNDYAVYLTSDTSKIQYMGPSNIEKMENYGISTSLYFPVTRFWTCQAYFNLYRNHFSGKSNRYQIDMKQTAYSFNSTQSFMLPDTWGIELSGNYSSPTVYGYTRNRAMGMVSVGVKKELFKGKVVAKLNFQDIFYTFQYRGKTELQEFNSNYSFRWDNRVISLSLLWKLERNASLLQEKIKN